MQIIRAFVFGVLTFLNVLMTAESDVKLTINDGASSAELIGGDIFFEIIEPEELSFTYRAKPAKDFGVTFNDTFYQSGVPLVPIEPSDGCSYPKNAEDLEGNIALVERGKCSFLSKTMRAQEAGAIGAIITDDDETDDSYYIEMIDDNTNRNPQIPAAFLLGING
ncbi:PRADC1-like protein [Nilaparvata lugens]|uniref:PRADC1-like protein n=1 Tax=Nilaparvata lugens TaxID=108931 RepID=UPI00193E19AA|nr:PRADC1-like protein [Nilaparvata lugens]